MGGVLKSVKYGNNSTVPLLFWPKTAGQTLQCADKHYCGEERTSDLSTFLASHGNTLTRMVQNLNIKCGIYCLTFGYIFMVNYTFAVEKQNQHCLYPWFLKSKFFGGRCVPTAPFETLALYFWIICKTLALVTNNYRVQKVWGSFDRFNKIASVIKALFFLFGCQCMRHKPRTEFQFL